MLIELDEDREAEIALAERFTLTSATFKALKSLSGVAFADLSQTNLP